MPHDGSCPPVGALWAPMLNSLREDAAAASHLAHAAAAALLRRWTPPGQSPPSYFYNIDYWYYYYDCYYLSTHLDDLAVLLENEATELCAGDVG